MSDEVSNFLRSVEQLKEKRDQEDEARSRELEERFLKERLERQARREERARSISPQKSSPANTPPPASSQRTSAAAQPLSDGFRLGASPLLDSPATPSARAPAPSDVTDDASTDYSTSPTKENDALFDPDTKRSSYPLTSPSTAAPSARSPLSWQRRPLSQASDLPKSRPLSVVAAENASSHHHRHQLSQHSSHEQVAQALSPKDPPSRQTTDHRGKDSADAPDMAADDDLAKPDAGSKLGSPLVLNRPPRLDPPNTDSETDSVLAERGQGPASPGSRSSPTRPRSPTKGMGGFVQSAMMKRSDSVKRWSVTSPTGLQRADSAASNRSGFEARPGSRPNSMLREGSLTPSAAAPSHETAAPEPSGDASQRDDDDGATPPASPSKTMDPRRWSPTKSSWLEAALNKPESPKQKPTPAPSNQPAWMVELNKARAQKANSGGGSVDLGRPAAAATAAAAAAPPRKHEVKTGGLLRSSPMGATAKPPPAVGGLSPGAAPSIPTGDKAPVANFRGNLARRPTVTETTEDDSAAETKAKADAPAPPQPKNDFRTNLKSRPAPADAGNPGQADELKNVFGNLRRTRTQNYVAPDELKSNILRGKAALNVTGGPKPSERKDEFKDAILKKKDDFKKAQQEGRGITRTSSTASDKPVPEGLVKRLEMGRSGSFSKPPDSAASSEPPSEYRESNRSSTISSLSSSRGGASADATPLSTPKLPAAPEEDATPTLPAAAASPPKTEPQKVDTQKVDTQKPEASAPTRLGGRPGANSLADRFNPALAGILARGPPGTGSASSSPRGSRGGGEEETESDGASGPQLTHMTKNRARGPRRKAPSAAPSATLAAAPSTTPAAIQEPPQKPPQKPPQEPPLVGDVPPRRAQATESPANTAPARLRALSKPATAPGPGDSKENSAPVTQVIALVDSSKKKWEDERPPSSAGRPIAFGDSPGLNKTRPRSPTKIQEQVAALAAKSQNGGDTTRSRPTSPKKLDADKMPKLGETTSQGRPRSPTKEGSARPLPEPPSAKSPPPSAASPPSIKSPLTTKSPPSVRSPRSSSPAKHLSEASAVLADFFGPDRPDRKYNVDAAEILMRRPAAGPPKIRTQKAQLFQVSGDGKKVPVPAHYERVLFEREMYLCPHEFVNEAGKKTREVYLWAGDEVAEAAVEDAHVFAQREAKAFGGRLVRLAQGKEAPEFLQALGGVVIVRRGSSNRYDSLAPNMLCGRRFHGAIVFDEVLPFSPASLCSGFAYLITQQGNCTLWKGRGSDVAELSCARLVGMDLALMGELAEVEDGSEAPAFWDLFAGADARPASADHWRLKPNYDKYCGRLFRSDAADPKQIIEISPFSQADLRPTDVFVLDAFFEMYVIVGARAQDRYASFRNALDFAQEYAILASGMEDRPFVPISTVVFEGVPRDLKSVFRKWSDAASPTLSRPQSTADPASPNPQRGRSLRVVSLTHALQAMAE